MMSLTIGVLGEMLRPLLAVQSAQRTSGERSPPLGPKYDMIESTSESWYDEGRKKPPPDSSAL
jgi:hypothetical protein